MNENQSNTQEFNRRDFLKSGSMAAVMAMLGGVELQAAESTPAPAAGGPKIKVAVIGLGAWGREILNNLARIPQAEVAAICDTYPASIRRAATSAPGATQTEDYKTILANADIKAVIIATPTHLHKDLCLAAIQAGKHVYCEAPLATTIEDARAIASAAKAAKTVVFQPGLQMRSEPLRQFLISHIRSGLVGQPLVSRSQWHKKVSWRATSPKPEREKELNWRLSKETSIGLVGELGVHPIDQATWFLNAQPKAVTGFGTIALHKDGRDVPDTTQVVYEFPNGVTVQFGATLANSFDADYEMLYGTDAAMMLRDGKAWLFKEVDSPLLGWEVYASKETFYKETGIVLKAGTSKATSSGGSDSQGAAGAAPGAAAGAQAAATTPAPAAPAPTNAALTSALTTFVRNAADLSAAAEDAKAALGDDAEQIAAELEKVPRRPAAGFQEGYQATVNVIKANEAIMSGKRIEFKPEWYELG
jgi:predicted dehydrogenase